MKVKFIFMGLLLMMSFTACEKITTEAPETLEKIRVSESPAENENAVFSVIIDEWPPYTTSETLEKGICTEIVVKALEAAGMPYKIEFKPWSRALEMVAFGDAWGTVPWFYTEERSKSYAFSDTIFTSNSVVFYHKDNPLFPKEFPEFSTLQDLKAYTFGGVHGYYYEPIFENESFSYTLSQSLESAFKLLIEGKTDVVN